MQQQELAELHAHLTTSIPSSVFWHIAHAEGYKLPKRDFRTFSDWIVLSPEHKLTLKEYLDEIYHPILNKLSSGSLAVEKAVYESFGGAYRANNITVLELRTNPMKHNHEGTLDLDHIIMAMLRGMEKALLEYPKLKGGIIFCLDRQFGYEKNEIIVDKAIKYKNRGIIGIDFANYDKGNFYFKDYTKLMEKVKENGLQITAHSGETNDTNDMWECLKEIKPARIGHGIKAAYDNNLMKELAKQNIILEVCPLSNLMTKAIKDIDELRFILNIFWQNQVKFCINTDWPETVKNAQLSKQIAFLLEHNILTQEQINQTIKWSFEASFIPKKCFQTSNLYL